MTTHPLIDKLQQTLTQTFTPNIKNDGTMSYDYFTDFEGLFNWFRFYVSKEEAYILVWEIENVYNVKLLNY